MSLQANFAEWCRQQRLSPVRAVYLEEKMWDLHEGEARIVRMVDRTKRAGNRETQLYLVEQLVNDTISYPLGTEPMDKKTLLRTLIRASMERKAQ